jgi:hypothetical protein
MIDHLIWKERWFKGVRELLLCIRSRMGLRPIRLLVG